jgi:tetratricopeptide (TPR) repeat protein
MTKREKAANLDRKATELKKQGQFTQAIDLYQQAIAADRYWSVPLYNLGLLFKHQHRWPESLEYNRRAVALAPADQAAWWNLGIAATALGDWEQARAAWRGFGIPVPDGEGPLDFPCGYGPIRINPDGDAEVVWAYRIDPARAVLNCIPFPESKHRWGDVVLNDGAPNGYRKYKGQEIPVFDELELLVPSPFGTYVARVVLPERGEDLLHELARIAADQEGSAEDWSTSVRMLCKACSEGRPHADHDTAQVVAEGLHLIGIAARDRRHATRILSAWESSSDDIQVESLDDALAGGGSADVLNN